MSFELVPAFEDFAADHPAGSMSHWMASVISSSPRDEGSMAATPRGSASNRYTPTSARSDGGSPASRRGGRRGPSPSSSATPNRCGSGPRLRRIWATGAAGSPSSVGPAPPPGQPRSARRTRCTPCLIRLSPRYMTKSSSPRNSQAISTQWARPRARPGEERDLEPPPGTVADRRQDLGACRRR